MSELPFANRLVDLLVYQKACRLAQEIFQYSRGFPREEMYSLTDQVRRSSRSVGAQIAEAWAKRRYEKHFVSKLTDADGELQETLHWIKISYDCGYLNDQQLIDLRSTSIEIGKMIGGMILKAGLFCGEHVNTVSEQIADYMIETE